MVSVNEEKFADVLSEAVGVPREKTANLRFPRRSLVFVQCANRVEFVLAYARALEHGIVPLLLDRKPDSEAMDRQIRTYRPNFIYQPVVDGRHVPVYGNLKDNIRQDVLFPAGSRRQSSGEVATQSAERPYGDIHPFVI